MANIARRFLTRPLWLAGAVLLLSGCDPAETPSQSTEVAARSAQSAAFSPGAEYVLIGSGHHGGSLWRLRDDERLYDWNHQSGQYTLITRAAFSPEGTKVVTSDGQTLVLWDVETGAAEQFWSIPSEVLSLALGPEGQRALVGLADNRASLYHLSLGGVERNFPHEGRVRDLALSADGRLALTGGSDNAAILWDASNGDSLRRLNFNDEVYRVALSPNGQRALSAGRYDSIQIWNTSSGEQIWRLPVGEEKLRRGLNLSAATFDHSGDRLLTGRPDGLVQLWDVSGQRLLREWRLPTRKAWQPTAAAVLAVGFAGEHYYAAGSDGFVHRLE